ncbi:MAG: potassium channel family protein [bacterium]
MYTLIVGCGRMGSELAIMLSGEGHDVVVIDKSAQAFRRLGPAFNGMTVTGNGFNGEVLESAGIKQANALAAVTNDDNTNIIAVQIAKQIYTVPMAVARVYDPKKAATYHHLGLEIISSTMVISRMIRDRFLENRVEEFLTPRQDRVEFHTIEVKGALVGRPAGDLNRPGLFTVITVQTRGRMTLPLPDYTLEEGDEVMGVGLVEGRDAIHNLLWGKGE